MAAHYGSENVARLLINCGADVNFMARVSFINPGHNTTVHMLPEITPSPLSKALENLHQPILLTLTDPQGGGFCEDGTNPYSRPYLTTVGNLRRIFPGVIPITHPLSRA